MIGKLTFLMACLLATALLTGCNEDELTIGGSSNPSDYSSYVNAGSGSGSSSGSAGATRHLPEPTTVALLGSGLVAYALYRRKKSKR